MNIRNLNEIEIKEDRQRQHFEEEKIQELALSIDTIGLLHPPTLSNNGFTLIAGEYRLKAIEYLFNNMKVDYIKHDGMIFNLPEIPVFLMHELSESEQFEVELEENLRRHALTWKEEAKAISKLHEYLNSKCQDQVTPAKIALKLAEMKDEPLRNLDVNKVRKSLQIEKFLDYPEVAEAPSLKDAETAARKILTSELEDVLAESGLAELLETKESSVAPETTKALITIKQGNYQDHLFHGADLYLLDPPYFVGADNFGTQAITAHNYDDDRGQAQQFYTELAYNTYACAAEQAHLYMFFDLSHWDLVKQTFESASWKVWHKPLIWVKDTGMYPDPEHGPRYTYECIMMAAKNRRPFNGVFNDTFICDTVRSKVHAAQKPVELLRRLAKTSIKPGSKVVDYFGGSGSIISALKDEEIFLHVVEKNADNYKLCMEAVHRVGK